MGGPMSDRVSTDPKPRAHDLLPRAAVVIICLSIIGAVLFPVTSSNGRTDPGWQDLAAYRSAATAAMMYAADQNDHLPPAASWMDALTPYLRPLSKSPPTFGSAAITSRSDDGVDQFGTALRRHLAGTNPGNIEMPAQVALIFNSIDLRRNASGELNLLPHPPRYTVYQSHSNVIAFADGHSKRVREQDEKSVR